MVGEGFDTGGGLTLGRSGESKGDEVPEARTLAADLDRNHPPEPGGLKEIGTCRRCGLIIAQDDAGVWSHQPSVGEIDAGETWLDRNLISGIGRSGPPDAAGESAPLSSPSRPEGES